MAKSKKIKKNEYSLEQLRELYEDFIPEATLDYHEFGMLNEQAVREIYKEFIEESLNLSQNKLLIITGKGQMVRPLVSRLLAGDKRIRKYGRAGEFQGKDGAFEVELH